MCAQSQSLVRPSQQFQHIRQARTEDFAFHALQLNHLIQSDMWHESCPLHE
jgi:hypothetical protein